MNYNVKVLRQGTGACLDPCGVIRFPHVIPDVFNPPLSFPTFLIGNPSFPIQGHPNEGTEEKDTGFPLKTCGNDRGGPADMTEGTGGHDGGARAGSVASGEPVARGVRAGMTKEPERACGL